MNELHIRGNRILHLFHMQAPAPPAGCRMNINKALSKKWEAVSMADLLKAPVSAFQGLTQEKAANLGSLGEKRLNKERERAFVGCGLVLRCEGGCAMHPGRFFLHANAWLTQGFLHSSACPLCLLFLPRHHHCCRPGGLQVRCMG